MELKVGDIVELEFTRNGYNADDEYTECWTEANYNDVEVAVNCSGVKPVSGMYPYYFWAKSFISNRISGLRRLCESWHGVCDIGECKAKKRERGKGKDDGSN